MPSKMYNRARMTVTSTGTGNLSLGVAVAGYQTFSSSGAQNGDAVSYTIEDGVNWEVGTGTFNSVAGTLSRTVTQSYNGTSYGTTAISVTTNAQVYITALAADIVVNGGALGTPSSGTLTNATGLPISTGVSGLGTGIATFLATPTSDNLAAAVTDETGTGALVFASSPTIATPTLSTSFTSPLHIGGTTASSTLTLQSTSGVGTSDSIVFKVGNNGATTAATFDTSGNLGIGTSSPSSLLEISKSQNADTAFRITNVGGGASSRANIIMATNASNYQLAVSSTYIQHYTSNAIPHQWWTSGVQAMTLDASGNLGVGTTGPIVRLHTAINSSSTNSAFLGNQNTALLLQNTSNTAGNGTYLANSFSTGAINAYIGFVNVDQNYASAITFGTSTSGAANYGERMRIDSSGNLLVNTTSAGVGKLCVYTSSNTVASADFRSTASGDVGNRSIFISKFDNDATTSQIFIQFAINNANIGSGQINADGANTAAFGAYSDIRLKENITPLPCQLSKILALKPSEFDYRDGSGHQIGFIAQEMQEVYPDVVGEGDDGMLTITGWSKTAARLVSAIQELAAKVSALEAKQ